MFNEHELQVLVFIPLLHFFTSETLLVYLLYSLSPILCDV